MAPYSNYLFPYRLIAIRRYTILSILFVYFSTNILAQPATPKFEAFKPIIPTQSYTAPPIPPFSSTGINPMLPNDPYREQNNRMMQQAGMTIPGQPSNTRRQQLTALKEALKEEAPESNNWVPSSFQNNFQQFLNLNPDSFSITKAVYLAESAYDPAMPPYEAFEEAIKQCADLVKQIIKREGLNSVNNVAVNYAIQKLYQQPNIYYDPQTKTSVTVQPLRYDFDDMWGDKNWRKMFVSKLLETGSGQCHSLPLFFLCVAEQLNAKAYLSLSPNHSFIQYFDKKGNRYNFETTNGNLVTQTWLMQSTYINATALKKGTYLDTLSGRKLYAQCLADLMLGYIQKIGYDQFSDQIANKILSIDSTNIAALMTQANYYYFIFRDKLRAMGNPPQDAYPSHPQLLAAYKMMQAAQQKVEQTGFQEMPEEAYQRWLKSLEQEKQKQQYKLEQERLQQEIRKLKKIKSTFINKPKQ